MLGLQHMAGDRGGGQAFLVLMVDMQKLPVLRKMHSNRENTFSQRSWESTSLSQFWILSVE